MPESIVINYWGLNQVYVIIASFIFIGFLILYAWLFIHLQIKVSKELNTNCQNPIAIYFDKANRDRCLTKKITKSNELYGAKKSFNTKVDVAKKNIAKLNKTIQEVNNYYDSLNSKESPEINRATSVLSSLQNWYNSVKMYVDGTKKTLDTVVSDFETSVNTNVQLAVDVGNNLVYNLSANKYTSDWKDKRQKMVDSYDKIKSYLDNENSKVHLDKINQNSVNPVSLKDLPNDARTGP
jgi:prefoldin subunit 5